MSKLTAHGQDGPMSDYRKLEERLRERHLLGDCVLAAGVIKALMEENARFREALALIESQRGAPAFELCNLARAALEAKS